MCVFREEKAREDGIVIGSWTCRERGFSKSRIFEFAERFWKESVSEEIFKIAWVRGKLGEGTRNALNLRLN